MAIGRLDIFDSYAEDALKKFGMEQTCTAKMLQVSENITYMVKNKVTGANEAVMRISRPGYRNQVAARNQKVYAIDCGQPHQRQKWILCAIDPFVDGRSDIRLCAV